MELLGVYQIGRGIASKAPAKVLADKCRALAEEHGRSFMLRTMQSKGMSEKNAKRQFRRLVKKFGLSVRIPISHYTHREQGKLITLPWMKPRDILEKLFTSNPWLFFGGVTDTRDAETLLTQFWACYRREHPEHELFGEDGLQRLHRTFFVTVHGDGGRTQKQQPLEVLSMQPVLGLDCAVQLHGQCRCETIQSFGGANLGSPAAQCLNSKHSTYLTHYLIFAFPSKRYRKFKKLLTSMLKRALEDLALACQEGLDGPDGEKWFPALIGFRLDMEWMAKVGSLDRSYQNVGTTNPIPCCHECDAGTAAVHFEDVNVTAKWISTCWNTIPWSSTPPWHSVAFDTGAPAKFLRRDSFHIFRMGIGRNFLGSSIILFVRMGCSLTVLL